MHLGHATMRWMWSCVLVILGALGCGSSADDPGRDSVSDTESTEPRVHLLAPEEGDTVCGDPFALSVTVDNFHMVGFDSEERREGYGHVDIQLNGQNRWMTYKSEFEIPHVDEGIYLVKALLVYEDHLPVEPEVSDSATVTVDEAACPVE